MLAALSPSDQIAARMPRSAWYLRNRLGSRSPMIMAMNSITARSAITR